MEKKVIELFAGVGGFRVGLNNIKEFDKETGRAIEQNDWDFVWANQWEPSTKVQHAYDCYTQRFGSEHVSNEDISKIDKSLIPDHSLLVGGFPCQDYSVARSKSTEQGIKGKKGVLFWEITEILKAKQTPFFLLENVDRLLKSPAKQRGRDFGIMLRTLSDLGYDVEWRVINAAEYGRAQRRRRVFIFGWRRDLNYAKQIPNDVTSDYLINESFFAKSFPLQTNVTKVKKYNLLELSDTVEMTDNFSFLFENTGICVGGQVLTLSSKPIEENAISLGDILDNESDKNDYLLSDTQIEKFKALKGSKKIERVKPNGEIYYYSEGSMSETDLLNLPGRTMLTSEASVNRSTHIIIDPLLNKKRFITPIEAERLQDFPDNWTNSGMPEKRRYFMMGNALVTGIVYRLEIEISNLLEIEN